MVRKFFAQRSDLLGSDWAGVVSPLASFVRENVCDLFIGQRFVPRLHHRCAILLSLHFDRTLQAFKNDARRRLSPASGKFATRKGRILTRHSLAVGLVTCLTVRRENLFAPIVRR